MIITKPFFLRKWKYGTFDSFHLPFYHYSHQPVHCLKCQVILKEAGHFKDTTLEVFWDSFKDVLDNLIVSSCQLNIQIKNGKYQYADGMSIVNKCES